MPGNQRSCPGVWGEALGGPRDKAKAGLPEAQSPAVSKPAPAGKTSETGAGLCDGVSTSPWQPPRTGALSNEDS